MDKFENKLKDKLLNKNMELDTDELWGEVYPHIKKKKRRFVVFYFLGFLLLASLSTMLYYTQGNKTLFVAKHITDKQSEIALIQNQTELKTVSEKNNKAPIKKENEQVSVDSKKYNSTLITDLNEQHEIAIEKDTPIANKSIRKNAIVKMPHFEVQKEIRSIVAPIRLTEEEQTKKNSAIELTLNTEQENNTQEIEYLKLKPLLTQIDDLKVQDRKMTKIPMHEFQSNYRSHKSNFSLFGALGGSMINKQLATRDGMSSEHLQRRLSNESSLESIDLSLGFNYALKENFEISLGLNFRRINEKISDTYTRVDTVLLENVIIENIISSRGTEAVYGDVLASRTIETNLDAYNRYNDLSAFVDFRYFFGVKQLRPFASLGYQQSVYSDQSGYWLGDEQLYNISEDDNNYISNSFGPAVRFGLGLGYDFSENTSIRFEGRFLKYVNSITNDSYLLSQKYTLIGLQTGLNIKL